MTAASQALARAGLIVSTAVFASRVLGWLRTVVISTVFGAGPDLDAYFAAFRIPDLVFQLVAAGALTTALIPVLAGLFAHGEDDRAWRVVATVGNVMMVALLVLTLAVELSAPQLVRFITPGFTEAQLALTVQMTRVMMLSPLFLALAAVAASALNASGRFAAAAAGPLLYNGAIIGAALLLSSSLGVQALAIGVALGALLNLAVQLPQVVRLPRFGYGLRVDLGDAAAREALLLMLPRAIGLGVTQITFLVNTALATTQGAGALTDYNVAFTILQIPIGVIGIPLGIVLLPSLSRAAALERSQEFAHLVLRALRLLLYVMLFITAAAVVLPTQIATILFDYGRFSQAAIEETAYALVFFLVGLAGHALIVVLARAFYAGKDTRTPVVAAVLSVGVNVVVSILTVGSLGIAGLALGISAGAWFEAILLIVLLRRRSADFDAPALGRAGLVFGAGAGLAGVAAWLVVEGAARLAPAAQGKLAAALVGAVASLAAGLVYLAFSRLARVPELGASLALLRAALPRRGPGPA